MATLSIAGAAGDALRRLTQRRVAALFVPLFLVHLAITVGAQSQLAIQRERLAEEAVAPGFDLAARELPLAVDLPLGVAALLWLAGFVALATVSVVALRALVTVQPSAVVPDGAEAETEPDGPAIGSDERSAVADGTSAGTDGTGSGPDEFDRSGGARGSTLAGPDRGDAGSTDGTAARRRDGAPSLEFDGLPSATASGIGAAVLVSLAVGVGLAAFVLPGLYLAAAFAFALPAVATARASALESLRSSWRLTGGHRLRVFGVLLVIWAGYLGFGVIGGVLAALVDVQPVGDVLAVALDAVAWLFALAVLAAAFDRLETIRAAEAAKWAGVDDELLP